MDENLEDTLLNHLEEKAELRLGDGRVIRGVLLLAPYNEKRADFVIVHLKNNSYY